MRHEFIVPATSQRFVVVHVHIFKNGGSTLESILEREFAGQFATVHGPCAESVLTGRDLAAFVKKNPSLRAVSSHHFRYPFPVIPGVVFFDCCFLRHPLARLHSVYSQFRRSEDEDRLSRMARQGTIGDFLRFLIDHAPHMVNNVQVTQLANSGEFRRPCDEPDLRRASKIVREMAIPGVVEMFDESLAAAEYFLKPVFPELSLEYAPCNMSGSVESRALLTEDALREVWGNDLFEELWYINHLDLDLFRFATEEVARRNSLVPRFSRKLEEFRSRCARLRSLEEAPLAELAADRPMVVTR